MSVAPLSAAIPCAVVTVSDSSFEGKRPDASGPAVTEHLNAHGWIVLESRLVPDVCAQIMKTLEGLVYDSQAQVIFTTGGTGVAPRDVTPEATRRVITREIPGLAELMRADGLRQTRRSVLSRGVVGICQNKVIVNLPGSPKAAVESLISVLDLLPHVSDLVNGRRVDH